MSLVVNVYYMRIIRYINIRKYLQFAVDFNNYRKSLYNCCILFNHRFSKPLQLSTKLETPINGWKGPAAFETLQEIS